MSSLPVGDIVDERPGPRDIGHARGSTAWGRATPTEKKVGRRKMRWLEEG